MTAQLLMPLRTPDFDIDLLDRCVRFPDGEEVLFTPRQWQLLEFLVRPPLLPRSRDDLCVELFGGDGSDEEPHLALLVRQLQRKLERDISAPRYLRSVDAKTYVFDPSGGDSFPGPVEVPWNS